MPKNENQDGQSGEEMLNDIFEGMDRGETRLGGNSPSQAGDSRPDDSAGEEPSRESGGSRNTADDSDDGATGQPTPPMGEGDPPSTDWEKRFKDTQKSFNEERQKRLQLEQQLQAFSKAQESGETTDKQDQEVAEILDDLAKEFEEDPDEAFARALKLMRQENEKIAKKMEEVRQFNESQFSRQLEQQERAAKKRHQDYESMVDEDFIRELDSSEELARQWQEQANELGDQAEAAYQLARRHKAYKEFVATGKMPAWASDTASKPKSQTPSDSKTLSDVTSAPPPKSSNQRGRRFASLDDVDRALFGHI